MYVSETASASSRETCRSPPSQCTYMIWAIGTKISCRCILILTWPWFSSQCAQASTQAITYRTDDTAWQYSTGNEGKSSIQHPKACVERHWEASWIRPDQINTMVIKISMGWDVLNTASFRQSDFFHMKPTFPSLVYIWERESLLLHLNSILSGCWTLTSDYFSHFPLFVKEKRVLFLRNITAASLTDKSFHTQVFILVLCHRIDSIVWVVILHVSTR